jgi:hypothetical protein
MPDPKTEELQLDQIARERQERARAQDAPPEESDQHERRADKAAYLKEKLRDRAASEDAEAGTSPP